MTTEILPTWKDSTLAAIRIWQHAEEFFLPPANENLHDLESMAKTLGFFDVPVDARPPGFPIPGEAHFAAAKTFAAVLFNKAKKETLSWSVANFLRALDSTISRRLEQGETHQDLVLTNDFAADGLHNFHCAQATVGLQEGVYLAVGLLDSLPAGHPLRNRFATSHWIFRHDDRNSPAVVLGPAQQRLSGPPGAPRPFYSLASVQNWTGFLCDVQEKSISSKPVHNVTTADLEWLKERENQRRKMPKVAHESPIPWPTFSGWSWRQKVEFAVSVYAHPERFFVQPAATVPIDDLLLIRRALGVHESTLDPVSEASAEFAAAHAGEAKGQIVANLLAPIMLAIQHQIALAKDNAVHWAAVHGPQQFKLLEERIAKLEVALKGGQNEHGPIT